MKTIIVLLALTSSAYALEPVVKSGTRLQARQDSTAYAGADGSSVKIRGRYYIYDTAIGHKCEITTDPTGTHCTPTDDMIEFAVSPAAYSLAFSDAACKMPFLQTDAATAAKVRYFWYKSAIYQVGVLTRLSTVYLLLGSSCVRYGSPGAVDAYAMTVAPMGPALTSSASTEVMP